MGNIPGEGVVWPMVMSTKNVLTDEVVYIHSNVLQDWVLGKNLFLSILYLKPVLRKPCVCALFPLLLLHCHFVELTTMAKSEMRPATLK